MVLLRLERVLDPSPEEGARVDLGNLHVGAVGFGGRTRQVKVAVDGSRITVTDDAYSDRVRIDHPRATDGAAVGRAAKAAAELLHRSRVVVLADAKLRAGLERVGLSHEATMPGFYAGKADCAVMGIALDDARQGPAFPEEVAQVTSLVEDAAPREPPADVTSRRATAEDAPAVASLLGATFFHYPTPSDDGTYIAGQIEAGTPFRVVEQDGEVVACASADLVPAAKTAELTDCATRPDMRGRGLMRRLLADLMDDLRDLGYPTAFTLARARVPGVNLAFARLGFELRGRMDQSCRIGDGLEDMNVLSRSL